MDILFSSSGWHHGRKHGSKFISSTDELKLFMQLYTKNSNINHSYINKMKTLSIHKDKTSLASETVGKWWNSKNVFFSLLTEENFSNREVVLVHLILIALIICAAAVEVSLLVSFLSLLAAGGTCCIP